ncbi:methyltransferase [Penicillium lagena]|uniref:methyltransferase n=1 Tax=Penicillium lagena TaxID=94218 RepID=UPI0025425D1F|nr:methyltransferase [Penicillium lagena]KAJ5601195.1 methyltransferase [Penicillium lagena]
MSACPFANPDRLSEASYTRSITSSALNYQYHSYHEGEYILVGDTETDITNRSNFRLKLSPMTKENKIDSI